MRYSVAGGGQAVGKWGVWGQDLALLLYPDHGLGSQAQLQAAAQICANTLDSAVQIHIQIDPTTTTKSTGNMSPFWPLDVYFDFIYGMLL